MALPKLGGFERPRLGDVLDESRCAARLVLEFTKLYEQPEKGPDSASDPGAGAPKTLPLLQIFWVARLRGIVWVEYLPFACAIGSNWNEL